MFKALFLTILTVPLYASLRIEMENKSAKAPVKLLIVTSPNDNELSSMAKAIQHNFQRSGQFIVTLDSQDHPKTKSEVKKFFPSGYTLVVFLNQTNNNKGLEWRLYDATDAEMLKGKKVAKKHLDTQTLANIVSDELWQLLTQQPGSFSAKLAYTKRLSGANRNKVIICVCNSDGSEKFDFVTEPGNYVGLYWHPDSTIPTLYCSEFTRTNVRLVSYTLHSKISSKKVILNFPGTCVGLSVSPNANKAVYCLSGVIWQHDYDQLKNKSNHKVLIKNNGTNIAPILLPNDNIIFCSDARDLIKTGRGLHIFLYNSQNGTVTPITKEGFSASPSYCSFLNKLAYSKKINGVMQIFIYDLKSDTHQQITTDKGDKLECCWSPCGNYIAFSHQCNRASRIGAIHLALKKRFYLTPENEWCSTPAWSPALKI